MTRLLMTTACVAVLSAPAFAESDMNKDTKLENEAEHAAAEVEKTFENVEKAAETTAEEIEQTTENAVDATQNAASDVATDIEQTTDNAVDATKEAAADAAQATENTAEDAADATAKAANSLAETADNAADAVAETAENAAEATMDASENAAQAAEATIDEAARDAAIVMDDSWDADIATFEAPAVERTGWTKANVDAFTREELDGMRVYTTEDEWIGEIDNVVVDKNGDITGAVLGVGGFLGIGEKDVLVSFDSLTVNQEIDGDDMRAYVDATEEALEELPEYSS